MSMFHAATKTQLKARVAMDGPSGAGKTWTALTWATVLATTPKTDTEPAKIGRIALIDTERGSASLYSDRFRFDTAQINPPYDPDRLIAALRAAESDGYDVVLIDSLSHFWEGEGGVLDIADAAGQRAQGNSWAGWKTATPVLRHLVDQMLALNAHLIVTMRSKTDWAQEEYTDRDGRKKTRPVRIGMAPVMRAGMEYEFTVVGDLDIEHRMSITKSRCDAVADLIVQPGRAAEAGEVFANWLRSGEPVAERNDTDALVARMNQITDPAARKECKLAFADLFGNPATLTVSKLADARAFVENWLAPPEAMGGKASGPDGREGEEAPTADEQDHRDTGTGSADDTRAVPGVPAPPDPPKAARKYTTPQKLHIHAAACGVSEPDLDVVILTITNGRTASANDLSEVELWSATTLCDDVKAGREDLARLRMLAAPFLAAKP